MTRAAIIHGLASAERGPRETRIRMPSAYMDGRRSAARLAAARCRSTGWRMAVTLAAVVGPVAFVTGCGREPAPAESVVWVPGSVRMPLRGDFGDGAVCSSSAGVWIAYDEQTGGADRVRVRLAPADARAGAGAGGGAAAAAEPPLVAQFDGHSPSLAVDAAGAIV